MEKTQKVKVLRFFLNFTFYEGYREYAKQIRQEYIHYPEEDYKKGRTAVLKKLGRIVDLILRVFSFDLGQGSIFKTPEFFQRFESVAKNNLENEIEQLNSK